MTTCCPSLLSRITLMQLSTGTISKRWPTALHPLCALSRDTTWYKATSCPHYNRIQNTTKHSLSAVALAITWFKPHWIPLGWVGKARWSTSPPVANLAQLRQALLEEWDRIPALRRKRLVSTMIKRWTTLFGSAGDTPAVSANWSWWSVSIHIYLHTMFTWYLIVNISRKLQCFMSKDKSYIADFGLQLFPFQSVVIILFSC